MFPPVTRSAPLKRRAGALLCLALILFVAPNVVLCLAPDGHAAVESVLESSQCCAVNDAGAPTESGARAAAGASQGPCDAGACVDSRLLSSATAGSGPPAMVAVLVPHAAPVVAWRALPSPACDGPRSHEPGRGSARTNVLLI